MGGALVLEPGVRITGALITVTLSDGTVRTVDIPAEYQPDDVTATVSIWSTGGDDRRQVVTVTVVAGFAPSDPVGPPRSYYRTG